MSNSQLQDIKLPPPMLCWLHWPKKQNVKEGGMMLKCAGIMRDAFPGARNSSVDSSYRSTLGRGHKRSNIAGGSYSFLPHILQGLQFSCENMRFPTASSTGLEGRTLINNNDRCTFCHCQMTVNVSASRGIAESSACPDLFCLVRKDCC